MIFFILFIIVFSLNAATGLEMSGTATGNVTPPRGVFYFYNPTEGVNPVSKLCNENSVYKFKYKFDMKSVSHKDDLTEVNLLIYNPESGKWIWAASAAYNGNDSVEFELNYGKLCYIERDDVNSGGSSPNRFDLFLGMSKFKLVGEPIERRIFDGQGFMTEKTATPETAFRQDLSGELQGPEIVANFRNPKGSKDPFTANYTYSVEARSLRPIKVEIEGTTDGVNWEIYRKYMTSGSSIWKKLVWSDAPFYKKLEFVADLCS